MSKFTTDRLGVRERLVSHVQNLERLADIKALAADSLLNGFDEAKRDGFDPATLKVVLKLRKLTPNQRAERRALEGIYLAALGMLEGEALSEAARRRLDGQPEPHPAAPPPPAEEQAGGPAAAGEPTASVPPLEPQPTLPLKEPEEARKEGAAAAAAGKRIYDNPYPAGDPCRAAWDEGWCAANQSNGLEPPAAYQRRTAPPPPSDEGEPADKKGAA